MDGRMEGDESLSHGLTDDVAIEAAEDVATLVEEVRQPGGIGSGAGGGDGPVIGMKGVATEGVDGRFAEDDVGARDGRTGEEAKIFTGTRSHAAPRHGAGAAQFGADGLAVGVAEEEDGVGAGVSVEVARGRERVDQGVRQGALVDEIAADGVESA